MLTFEMFSLLIGICCFILGIRIWKGDTSLIHFYHQPHILPSQRQAYARWMGASTLILGCGLILTALLVFLFGDSLVFMLLPVLAIALAGMIIAQWKFNKGIF